MNVGDTIKIKNAVINVSRVYLDPSEDLDELKVYLAVIRNGETIPIAKPLTYRRAGYISSSWWGFAPYRLLERARKRAGVKSAEDHAVLLAAELDVLPMQEVYLLFDMAVGDLERLKVDIESSQRPGFDVAETQHGFGSMTDRIERLAAAFSRAGYAMAQVEAKTNLLPLAERGLTADQSQAKASAERRKAGDPVREAARSDIAVNPKTTQTACARRVATALGRDQRSVEKLIAPLFEWRDLPGGGREKRGMR